MKKEYFNIYEWNRFLNERKLVGKSKVLSKKTHYKDGEIDGMETWFYRTGEKLEEIYWKNGNQSGLVVGWNKNGRKKYETNGMNGKQEGLEKWWYKNGRKKSIKHYKKDVL